MFFSLFGIHPLAFSYLRTLSQANGPPHRQSYVVFTILANMAISDSLHSIISDFSIPLYTFIYP
jgi:hypothetical protein